jgi:hypothetical protein
VEIKPVSSGSLMAKSSAKGKGRATLQDDDMDVDGDVDCSKGRIVEPVGSFIKVLESFKNIAPIMDAVLVDTDGSGQVIASYLVPISVKLTVSPESNRDMRRRRKYRFRQYRQKWGRIPRTCVC